MTLLAMYDSVTVGEIPSGAAIVAGYVNGRFQTVPALRQRFPHARIFTIAVTADADAECLDVETGDATPGQAPGWHKRQRARNIARPCLYANASTMQAGIVPLVRSGAIPRALVRLWSAHYTGTAHICGPRSCGLTSIGMDGTQWTDKAMGRNLDQSLLAADFFGTAPAPVPVPAPPAKPATVTQPRRWITAGMSSIAALSRDQKTTPAAILQLTAQHGPFPADVAALVNGLCSGTTDPAKPMPKGLALYLPG